MSESPYLGELDDEVSVDGSIDLPRPLHPEVLNGYKKPTGQLHGCTKLSTLLWKAVRTKLKLLWSLHVTPFVYVARYEFVHTTHIFQAGCMQLLTYRMKLT